MAGAAPQMDTSKLKEKADQAVSRHNFPYAMEMYQQILSLDPNDVESRKALRAVALRHQQETGAGGFSVLAKNIMSFVKIMLPSKDYDKKMQECEKYLAQDPSNYKVSIKLGLAALAAGYNETAAWIFEDISTRIKPNDVPALRNLQQACRLTGEIQKALDINRKILQLVPSDRDASQALRDLSAVSMSTKIEAAGTASAERGKAARQIAKDDVEYSLKSRRISELRSIEEVKQVIEYTLQDIEKRPEDVQLRVKLGDLYVRMQEWVKAKETYEEARKLAPAQYSISMHVQDVDIKKVQTDLANARSAYEKNTSDQQARNAYSKLYDQFLETRLKYFVDREKNLPTDIKIAYELGNIFYELAERKKQLTGKFQDDMLDQAIARYQRTVKDPGVRQQSQLKLGICFFRKAQYDLAIRQFTEAIDSLEFMNDTKKELLYHRAKTYEAMGDKEMAKKDLVTIYEVDIDYRDVAQIMKNM
ncbi:MAG TPA: tetratricopeptide repeat protein [Planctomycetes bacterium]|nr:tetratricopeptide repeat protein [Planctomycetota bacterium]